MFCYAANLGWDAHSALAPLGDKAAVEEQLDALVGKIVAAARPGDHILVMSNGGFGGIHEKLLMRSGEVALSGLQKKTELMNGHFFRFKKTAFTQLNRLAPFSPPHRGYWARKSKTSLPCIGLVASATFSPMRVLHTREPKRSFVFL